MSRIRSIVAKSQKIQDNGCEDTADNEDDDDPLCTKDESEKAAMRELTARLPRLGALFTLHRKVGEGTFSSVYVGSLRAAVATQDRRLFAIKHLVPGAHPARVEHELRCLRDMGGQHNVVPLELCLRHLDTVVIVMPYIPHNKFSEYVGLMDAAEVADYLRALLRALKHVHSFGVIHRDIKPSNFLYDRPRRRYQLVDFGLAQRMVPSPSPHTKPAAAIGTITTHNMKRDRAEEDDLLPAVKKVALGPLGLQPPLPPPPAPTPPSPAHTATDKDLQSPPPPSPSPMCRPALEQRCACWGVSGVCTRCTTLSTMRAPRAGTQGFRPPEVLLKCPRQGPAVDVWAVGIVFCSVLCARYPLLRASDDAAALAELATLVGTHAMHRAAHALRRRLVVSQPRPRLCLRRLAQRLRGERATSGGTEQTAAACTYCHVSPCLCYHHQQQQAPDTEAVTCGFPAAAFMLCQRLLEPDPTLRPTAQEALEHTFLQTIGL